MDVFGHPERSHSFYKHHFPVNSILELLVRFCMGTRSGAAKLYESVWIWILQIVTLGHGSARDMAQGDLLPGIREARTRFRVTL